MSTRSASRSVTLQPLPPESLAFLVDRSLGGIIVPARVRALGYGCVTLADLYGDERAAQHAADTQWLDDAAPHDYVVLTRDGNLYVNAHERQAVTRGKHRIFWLGPKKGPGSAWADRFAQHHLAIVRHARAPGPYVVKVQGHGLERVWP